MPLMLYQQLKGSSVSLTRRLLPYTALLLLTACVTQPGAEREVFLASRVLYLKGEARCSMDGGKTWRNIKVGDLLQPGSLVQTARSSWLHVALGQRYLPVTRTGSDKGTK